MQSHFRWSHNGRGPAPPMIDLSIQHQQDPGVESRAISTHLSQEAGLKKPMAQTGAVTLIQRFGSALNLNIHFHMLFLDGVYTVLARSFLNWPALSPL